MTITRLWESPTLPDHAEYDGLFILGGPMNVYDVDRYPWLAAEQHFIARAISKRKPILGVCLGAQLLAVVLGGKVTEMLEKEIGWYPVELTQHGQTSELFEEFPDQFVAFHWHGDTFSVPPGAVHLARSEGCDTQAFVYDTHVMGIQFHLESDREGISAMIEHCGDDLTCGPFVQDPSTLLELAEGTSTTGKLLFHMLDKLSMAVELRPSRTRV